jgi:hypothetical protein
LPGDAESLEPSRLWAPQPGPQTEAICADWCPELLYGGAVGGGKSDFLLGDFLQDVPTYESAWRGVMLRRTYPELEELVARSLELYPATGAKWHEQKKTWIWSNGANLKMRYCESDKDVLRYHGHQYTWIGFDELTQWATLYPYRYLRTRLRSAHSVPTKRMRAASNPGGPGHAEVKAYFIDPAPHGFMPIKDASTGLERMFIPSRLENNVILTSRDPTYVDRVRGVGNANLVRALLEGDWSVIEGAFFTEWSAARHVLRPVELPEFWLRFRSGDWGSAKPYSFHWWAVASDDWQHPDGLIIPRGAMIAYRELYGIKTKPDGTFEANVGVKETAEEVAKRILTLEGAEFDAKGKMLREADEEIKYGVLDPAAFAEDGGPSIGERMAKVGVWFGKADNKRVATKGALGGHDQFRGRLKGDGDGRPMIYFFANCTHAIRTIPVLQHDAKHAEDVDTEMEDHAYDDCRYGAMSRPWVAKAPPPPVKDRVRNPQTMDELEKWLDRKAARERA